MHASCPPPLINVRHPLYLQRRLYSDAREKKTENDEEEDYWKPTEKVARLRLTGQVNSLPSQRALHSWKILKRSSNHSRVRTMGWTIPMQIVCQIAELLIHTAAIWDFLKHTYVGFKLFGLNIRTATGLALRAANGSHPHKMTLCILFNWPGHSLTRRERKLLVTATADLFRMVRANF